MIKLSYGLKNDGQQWVYSQWLNRIWLPTKNSEPQIATETEE